MTQLNYISLPTRGHFKVLALLFAALSFLAPWSYSVNAVAAPVASGYTRADLDPPTTTGIEDFLGLEDAGNHIISLWAAFEDDVDPDEALVFSIEGNTNAGLVTTTVDNNLGILTLSFSANTSGTSSITVRATDTGSEFAETTFNVTITAVNDAPSFTLGTPPAVNEDAGAQTVFNLATSISPGPADEAGQSTSFSITNNTNAGLFSVPPVVSNDGTLTYTPNPNVAGSATITLELSDDGGTANGGVDTSAPQFFTITVNEVNDEPNFTGGSNIFVDEDSGGFTQSNWATNIDAGPNEGSQTLTFILAPTNTNLFSVQPSISAAGTLSFTPALNAFGTSTVTVSLMDDGGTANGGDDESPSQTFTITINGINDRPTTSGISDVTDLEDTANRVINLFSAFDDLEDPDASLSYEELSNTNPAIFSSTTVNETAGTFTMNYEPEANGTSVITIRVTDTQGEFVDESFTVNLTSVNDEPSFTKGPDLVIDEDAAFQTVTNWATNISAGPANENTQVLTFEVVASNPGLFESGPDISSTGTLTYNPAANASGTALVTVTLMDNGGTANGGDNESPSQTFNITINGQNDQPTSTPISDIQVVEDAPGQSITLFDYFDDIEDLDTQLSYAVLTNSNPGLVTTQPISSANGLLTLGYVADQHGTSTLTILVTDTGGLTTSQTFSVEVLPVNDAPSFTSGGNVNVPEDSGAYSQQWATNISPGPANEASETVTFSIAVTDPTLFDVQPFIDESGVLSFTPKLDTSGETTATVLLRDNGGTANGGNDTSPEITITITINAQNDPPLAIDDVYTVLEGSTLTTVPGGSPPGLLDNDIDLDGDQLTGRIIQEPLHGTFSFINNGTLFYTHNGNEATLDSLKYVANDGTEDSNIATVIINIKESNDPPVANDIDDIIDQEDAPLQATVDLYAAFDDPDDADEDLSFTITGNTNPSLFANLIVNSETGRLELVYAPNANGSSTLTVQAADPGGLTSSTSFRVTLTPVNDPPSMTPGPDITLDEDPGPQSINAWATNIVAGPPDESGQTISVSASVSNPGLFSVQPSLNINGTNGTLTFTPAPQTDGQSTVTLTLTDNGGLNNSASYDFLITIQGDNDKPTSQTIDDIEANEDGATITFNLFDYFNDVEDEDEDLTFSLEGNIDMDLFENLSISQANPKILTINFAPDAFGETIVGIRATDSGGLFAQEDVKITLNPVNDAPSFDAGSDVTVGQNSAAYAAQWANNISVGPANESNQEAFFTVSITNGMEDLFADLPTISPDGVLSFTPAIGDQVFGDVALSVILADNGGTDNGGVSQSPSATFTISIRRLNSAPTGVTDNYIVDQGQTLQVGAQIGVLANDSDPENDDLTARLITGPANAASFTLNSDGSFTYRHNNTQSTNDAFTYVANDGFDDSNEITVAISIQPSGTLSLAAIVVLEDAEPITINVPNAIALPDDNYEFVISNISNPAVFEVAEIDTLLGILDIAYAPNAFGEANISITATPATGDPIFVQQKISILPVNDAPIAVDDITATIQNRPIEIDVISNDVDFDEDNLTLLRFSNPSEGTVQAQLNGNLLYTPDTDFTGVTTFTYSIRDDSSASAEGLVTITVFSGRFVVSEVAPTIDAVSAAYNISNAGEVVGASAAIGGSVQAFSSNQEIEFESPSEALDANDFGQIVGSSVFETDGNTGPVFQATRWDTSGTTNLGSLDGRFSKAYSINNAAQIVGISTKQNSELLRAMRWQDGEMHEMEASDLLESQAFVINEQGLAAGYAGEAAIIWRNGQIQNSLIGSKGRAYAINASGQTAGSIDDGTVKAVFWDDDGALRSLHVEGSPFSEAYGLNNATWVVGTYMPVGTGKTSTAKPLRKSDVVRNALRGESASKGNEAATELLSPALSAGAASADMRAFLWQGDNIFDLNDFIDETAGWVLLEARAINNAAQITGVGLYNGERKAFLLSPTINKAPTAIDDVLSLENLGPILLNVLDNDSDEDGDTLRIVSVTQGQFGEVVLENDRELTYRPGNEFTSSDRFTYIVEDGKGGSAEGTVEISIDLSNLPARFSLDQNFPNPFGAQTTIEFGLPEQTEIRLEVFNLLGQRVATLVDGVRPAGRHNVEFTADHLPGGVYIYRMKTTSGFEATKRLVLVD